MGKPISIWFNDEEEKLLKEKARKDRRSISNYVKIKCDVFKEKK
jgi:hypothetical protein